jgi:hypothetical protein
MMPDFNPMAMDDGFALRLAKQTLNEQRIEIERLTAGIASDQAEIERLKKACRDQAGVELSEENDRLMAALYELQGCDIDNKAQGIIRRALEGK